MMTSRLLPGAMAALVLLASASEASATGYPYGTRTTVPNGFSCLDFDTANILREMQISPLPDGPVAHTDGTLSVSTVTYASTNGWVLDWYQNGTGPSIHHVIVQGGVRSFAYSYDPPRDHDRNLVGDLLDMGPLLKPQYEKLAGATFCYSTPDQTGFDGCTLGYWKVPQHHDSWPAGYFTWTNQQTHFGPLAFNDTLLNALNYKGGSTIVAAKRLLMKQATAALLNAASPVVDYPLTRDQVISYTQFALGSNDREVILSLGATLDAYNNQGCTLN